MSLIAETAVSGTSYSFDKLFSYVVPEKFCGKIACGCRVLVPFGSGNKRRIGIVMKLSESDGKKLKSLVSLVDDKPALSDELIRLAFYLHEQTFCTYFDAAKIMLPPAMSVTVKERFSIVKNFDAHESLSEEGARLLAEIHSPETDLNSFLENYIVENGRAVVDELCDSGAVISDNVFRQSVGDATMKMVRLTDEFLREPERFKLTPKQKQVADFLLEYGSASEKEAAYMCGVTAAVVKRLAANGAAEEYEAEILRGVDDGAETRFDPDAIVLSVEQQAAHDAVFAQIF
ncbi:MAG: primosomal protein N', partial [Ruminococcus flavefaciens]|nr:primosomal protein N' [Ruminococcus flavefaciens]